MRGYVKRLPFHCFELPSLHGHHWLNPDYQYKDIVTSGAFLIPLAHPQITHTHKQTTYKGGAVRRRVRRGEAGSPDVTTRPEASRTILSWIGDKHRKTPRSEKLRPSDHRKGLCHHLPRPATKEWPADSWITAVIFRKTRYTESGICGTKKLKPERRRYES